MGNPPSSQKKKSYSNIHNLFEEPSKLFMEKLMKVKSKSSTKISSLTSTLREQARLGGSHDLFRYLKLLFRLKNYY